MKEDGIEAKYVCIEWCLKYNVLVQTIEVLYA